jgi:phosphoserine phosphatase RsbU/P
MLGMVGTEALAFHSRQQAEPKIAAETITHTVLVVDDSMAQRRILSAMLRRRGFKVVEANGGAAALQIFQSTIVDIVISDWMMPGLDGLGLCKAIRDMQGERYIYFILVTAKNEKEEVAKGLDIGADDFLVKPVGAEEFRARIAAGERLLGMQRQLIERNHQIQNTLAELQNLYAILDQDLIEAQRLQQSLVPERTQRFSGGEASLLLRPCGRVGGDLVGTYPIGTAGVGLFSIDVSGHGMASALLTARLAASFSGATPSHNIALTLGPENVICGRDPAEVAADLNAMMFDELKVDHYFTMALLHVDFITGRVAFVQAGHPCPVLIDRKGTCQVLGGSGMPIGLLPEAEFESCEFTMGQGEQVFVGSDGFTEACNDAGELLDQNGLNALIERNVELKGAAFLESLVKGVTEFADGQDFKDDVSAVLFEYLAC